VDGPEPTSGRELTSRSVEYRNERRQNSELILQTFNRLPRLKFKRSIRTYSEGHMLINASFSKMQCGLIHRLLFTSYVHLFVTNPANSNPLFSSRRNTIGNQVTNNKTNALCNFNK
jgi:hypothetical protein